MKSYLTANCKFTTWVNNCIKSDATYSGSPDNQGDYKHIVRGDKLTIVCVRCLIGIIRLCIDVYHEIDYSAPYSIRINDFALYNILTIIPQGKVSARGLARDTNGPRVSTLLYNVQCILIIIPMPLFLYFLKNNRVPIAVKFSLHCIIQYKK